MTKKKLPTETKIKMRDWGGRPPEYKTIEELKTEFENYVAQCVEKMERPTITGTAYFLGFESRQSMYDYEKRDGFSYVIKRIRLFIEQIYEQRIENGAGPIFALKNFGWTDRSDIGISGSLETITDIGIDAKIAALSAKLNGINEGT